MHAHHSGNPGTTNQALNRTTCDRRMVDWTLLVVKYGDKAITVWTTSSIQELSWYQKNTGICMDFKSFKISKHGLSCYNQQECLSTGYRATNIICMRNIMLSYDHVATPKYEKGKKKKKHLIMENIWESEIIWHHVTIINVQKTLTQQLHWMTKLLLLVTFSLPIF